ncbi:glycine cleavage system H mitochondrial-like [Raphidocelis subcapitata]|uniref:Glycine cleavage system H protein n=1 Tax=Raphidocelis subcapitata TaxID=307507 RepID=A0A2V0PQ51_9CHLO|nr:glycine cleavage system H mitochondrial-like [Raphidocelis subcapitata]|eukprot:GBF99325.1 glycine cleavage system H mitochondrial-like [Raphidocelis subcapitata]
MALRALASNAGVQWGVRTQFGAIARAFSSVLPEAKYAASHEWAKVEGSTATVGISDHAQSELGDVVYVELPEVGATVTKGETFGVVESVKAASDVYSPLSGKVVEINEALVAEPAKINQEPYSGGWMMKIELSDKGEVASLMDATAYQKHCEH